MFLQSPESVGVKPWRVLFPIWSSVISQSAFVSREECVAGDWRRVGFPISEAASCERGLAASPRHHTRNKVLIVCPFPAAAVLAQVFAALGVLVPGLPIWQLMMWLCLNCVSQSLSSAEPVMHRCCWKGKVLLPFFLFSCLRDIPPSLWQLVEPPVSLFTIC